MHLSELCRHARVRAYNTDKVECVWFKRTAHKLIGNELPISARVGKATLAMNLVHFGKISCLCNVVYMSL